MQANIKNRTIFCHDNLDVMRGMDSDSIDLIYLDPPFNTNRTFTAPIGSSASGAEFNDIFKEEDLKDEWVLDIKEDHPELHEILTGIKGMGNNSNYCYIAYMAIRLIECHRILKPTGSIYLHCDPTMSHYLKLMMDCVLDEKNFLNEIVWPRYAPHSLAASGFDTISDNILVYASDKNKMIANKVFSLLNEQEMKERFPHIEAQTGRRYQHVALEQSSNKSSAGEVRDIDGKRVSSDMGWRWAQTTFDQRLKENPHIIHWTGSGKPRYKIYADAYKGRPIGNIWSDIRYLSAGDGERTGYPTQKPLALLSRIIKASSNENDVVFDPFCGCATTCVAAEHLGRKWIGCDISIRAYELVKGRLKEEVENYIPLLNPDNEIHAFTEPPSRTDTGEAYAVKKHVYVISNLAYPDEYKVGIASNVDKRLQSYQTSDPERGYKLEFSIETDVYREIEREIHKHAGFLVRHEWVYEELQVIIDRIKELEKTRDFTPQ